jgi:hypothetical protein
MSHQDQVMASHRRALLSYSMNDDIVGGDGASSWDTHAHTLWIIYTIVNVIGAVLCILLIHRIYRLGSSRNSRQVTVTITHIHSIINSCICV